MLARLFLILLVVLAAPAAVAMPACHTPDAAASAMNGMSHHAPKPAKVTPSEALCIGCIAPATLAPPVLAARSVDAELPPLARALPGLVRAPTPPATPPPRLG